MRVIKWISTLLSIVEEYHEIVSKVAQLKFHSENLRKEVEGLRNTLRKHTTISADIAYNSYDNSKIIVTGRYKGNDYVEVFSVQTSDFKEIVDHLRSMEKHGRVEFVDAPMTMRAYIKRGE